MIPRLTRRALLPLIVAAFGLPAASAHAGTYTVYSCRDADGAPASSAAWTVWSRYTSIDKGTDSCPRGALSVAMGPGVSHASDASTNLEFHSPTDTQIVSYRLWRSALVAKPYYVGIEERTSGDWTIPIPGCNANYGCTGVGDPNDPLSSRNVYDRTPGQPLTGIALHVSCPYDNAGSSTCAAASPIASQAWLYRAAVTLADDVAPRFETPPIGSLVDATAPVSGNAPVSLQASDKGGGVKQVRVEVDGRILATHAFGGAGCNGTYTARVPCPLRASMTFPVDTSGLSDGRHSVRVLLDDAAGNTTPWGPVELVTRNALPDASCQRLPAVSDGSEQLTTWLARPHARQRRHRASLTVRYARHEQPRLAGRLTAHGAAVAGAGICIVWRPEGTDAPLRPLARLTTDAHGRFGMAIPRGSSRELWAVRRVGSAALARKALLHVVPLVRLHPSSTFLRNGEVLTLSGSIAGGPIPSRGVLVEAEAWRGTHWQPFGEARADRASGRFRIRYQFTATSGVQRYSLRVRVPAQAAYPYLAGASRPVSVLVSG